MWYVLKPTYRDESEESILCASHKEGARVDFYTTEEKALSAIVPELVSNLNDVISSCDYWNEDEVKRADEWANKTTYTLEEMREILDYFQSSVNPETYDVIVAEVICKE